MGLAIAYWLLPTTFALSHYCHVENQKSFFFFLRLNLTSSKLISANCFFQVKKVKLLKSFFNIESEVIEDNKHTLLFSSQKS